MSAELTPKEQSAILQERRPTIIRPSDLPCPFQKGETIPIKTISSEAGPVPVVSITILSIKRGSKGEWMPEYSTRDDRGAYLGKNGYTRSAALSIDKEAPVEDPTALAALAVTGRLRASERGLGSERQADVRRKRERAIRDRIRETLRRLDGTAELAFLADLERTIRKAEIA